MSTYEFTDGYPSGGAFVGRSSSFKALIALRALPLGGDLPKAVAALSAVKIHRLGDEGTLLAFVDTTERESRSSGRCTVSSPASGSARAMSSHQTRG
jgi:hypothetical protein